LTGRDGAQEELTMKRYRIAGAVCAALLTTLILAATASAAPEGATIVVPSGYFATISNATFGDTTVSPTNCPVDSLAYGYQLNGGSLNQLATGTGCESVAGTTIEPSLNPTTLAIYLTDKTCDIPADTYYSNDTSSTSHSLVTQTSSTTYSVSIMDSDVCSGTVGYGHLRLPPKPGTGNLNLTVTLTPICTATAEFVEGFPAYHYDPYLANVLIAGACLSIDEVNPTQDCQNNRAAVLAYEGDIAQLVADGFLPSVLQPALDVAAQQLLIGCSTPPLIPIVPPIMPTLPG
jgi:hypothetical protein